MVYFWYWTYTCYFSARCENSIFDAFVDDMNNGDLTSSATGFKGYLRYETILCHEAALDVSLMNFFILRKNNVSFSRYRDICVFVKPADLKICGVIIMQV